MQRLRDRKRRWAKPFAVMVADIPAVERLALVGATERTLLAGPERPIVLLRARRRGEPRLAPSVAAGNHRLGIFLPYTPLHHLLLAAVGRPIVLTSGNLSDEPLATDDADAAERLAGLADAFLVHDREIRARYDDSVGRVVAGRVSLVRRGRGYAPEALPLPVAAERPILAVGAELKHTFTLARGRRAHVAPHNGDLEDLPTHLAFTDGLAHLGRLLALEPEIVAHDLHPEYLSTKYAVAHFPAERRIAVQHHHAHVVSCAAEHGLTGPFIGVAYDGLGMGDDGTLWGGEILAADLTGYRRLARFGRAPLPGGALAVKKPWRMALGYILGAEAVGAGELAGARATGQARPLRPRPRRGLHGAARSARGRRAPDPGRPPAQRAARVVGGTPLRCRRLAARPPRRGRVRGAGRHRPRDRGRRPPGRAPAGARGPCRRDPRLRSAAHPASPSSRASPRAGRPACSPRRSTRRSPRSPVSSWPPRPPRPACGPSASRAGSSRTAASPRRSCAGSDGTASTVFINRRVPVNDGGISYGQAAVAAARMAAAGTMGADAPVRRA